MKDKKGVKLQREASCGSWILQGADGNREEGLSWKRPGTQRLLTGMHQSKAATPRCCKVNRKEIEVAQVRLRERQRRLLLGMAVRVV